MSATPTQLLSRRGLFGLLAGVGTTALLVPKRTIFLPPRGGWAQWPIAQMIIPRSDAAAFYADGIAAGLYSYDEATETMSLLKRDTRHHDDKWNSPSGRTYDLESLWDYPRNRAAIDDALDAPIGVQSNAKERARIIEKYSHPVPNLPNTTHGSDAEIADWGPPALIASLKADAIARGVPFVGDSYRVDMARWMETEDYRQWSKL